MIPGFTKDYGVKRLMFFEAGDTMDAVIRREKQLKKWLRAWKIELVERRNPHWDDLAVTILGFPPFIL